MHANKTKTCEKTLAKKLLWRVTGTLTLAYVVMATIGRPSVHTNRRSEWQKNSSRVIVNAVRQLSTCVFCAQF